MSLFAVTELAPFQCHLRFVKITVAALGLQRLVREGVLSGLPIMNETRESKSLALGPGRLLNVSYHPQVWAVDV